MALFKIARGTEANLPKNLTDGYAYFTSDTNNFYIDHIDRDTGKIIRSLSGVGKRIGKKTGEVFNLYEDYAYGKDDGITILNGVEISNVLDETFYVSEEI